MLRDISNSLKVSTAISPVNAGSGDTPIVSSIIDTKGFDSLMFAIAMGSLADANATFTTLVEDGDSDTLADNAAVADAQLDGTEAGASFTFAHDNSTRKIGYHGNKRYVRLTITPSGNTGDVYLSAVAIQGHAHAEPVAQ